ncbi:MAG: DUF3987 domain-containing protein [Caulobacter sp.]|nr:DUF3987 domain-containing protein [Caulobacter sp.]
MTDFLKELKDYNEEQAAAELAQAWEEPDTDLIDEGLLPAPAFPVGLFGPWSSWLLSLARSVSAPVDWAAVALLACAGACIGAARQVSPWRGWAEYPALWVLMVGKPSSGKSPVFKPFQEAMTMLEDELSEGYPEQLREYEGLKAVAEEYLDRWTKGMKQAVKAGDEPPVLGQEAAAPPPPPKPRLLVGDITSEALGVILSGNPRGVLKAHDELAAWIANNGKYGGDDVPEYLQFFNGAPHVVDRLNRESIKIARALVSILGGIQPDRFGELMVKRVDDGLLSRFFLIYPDPVARDRPDEVPDQAVLMSALRRLRNLDLQKVDGGEPVPIAVSLVDDAVAVFEPWWKHNEQQGQVASGFLAAFLGKGPGLVLRTALILEFLTWAHSGSGPPPDRISKRSIEAACAFFEDYLVPMTERVYGGWGRSQLEITSCDLLKRIKRDRSTVINAANLRRNRVAGLRKKEEVDKVLSFLRKGGWIRPQPSRKGQTKGRPRTDYEVNPKLWDPLPPSDDKG